MVTSRQLRSGYTVCLLAFLSFPACGGSAATPTPFDGQRAYSDLQEILQIGPRVAGTQGSARARDFILRELAASGITVEEHPFQAKTPFGDREMVNIVAIVPGSEPEIIVLGNHYDTKYFPDFEFVGANDGGSTTAWMLEMARALGPARQGHTVWLCWFDGEEAFVEWSEHDGLYGSRAMVERLDGDGTLPLIRAMINVDMIGDCDLNVLKDGAAPHWLTKVIWATAAEAGHGRSFSPMTDTIDDDHVPFRRAGIPAIELIDFRYGGGRIEHQRNWHTPRDRIDLVCADSLQAVGDVVYRAIKALDRRFAAVKEGQRDTED